MSEEMTPKIYAMVIAMLALLILSIAICGGAWGASDLELRVRASEPFKL